MKKYLDAIERCISEDVLFGAVTMVGLIVLVVLIGFPLAVTHR